MLVEADSGILSVLLAKSAGSFDKQGQAGVAIGALVGQSDHGNFFLHIMSVCHLYIGVTRMEVVDPDGVPGCTGLHR